MQALIHAHKFSEFTAAFRFNLAILSSHFKTVHYLRRLRIQLTHIFLFLRWQTYMGNEMIWPIILINNG